jgi:hypothetical protein
MRYIVEYDLLFFIHDMAGTPAGPTLCIWESPVPGRFMVTV